MINVLTWVLSLGLGLGLLELTRDAQLFSINALVAMAVSGNLVALAVRGFSGALPHVSHAVSRVVTAIYMLALIWFWLAIASLFLYSTVYTFAEGSARIGGFAAAGLLCACFAALMARGAGKSGGTGRLRRLLRFARLLAAMQVATALAVTTMLITSGAMTSIRADWAGNNALFFGSLALAAIAVQAVQAINVALEAIAGSHCKHAVTAAV